MWSCKCRLQKSSHIYWLELFITRYMEVEDWFRVRLQRENYSFLNGMNNIYLLLKLKASPADATLNKGGDESRPQLHIVDHTIASQARTTDELPRTLLSANAKPLSLICQARIVAVHQRTCIKGWNRRISVVCCHLHNTPF